MKGTNRIIVLLGGIFLAGGTGLPALAREARPPGRGTHVLSLDTNPLSEEALRSSREARPPGEEPPPSAGKTRMPVQETRPLSLEEAVTLGIENSKEVKMALSRARQAGAALRETRESRLPDLAVSGNYMRLGSAANMRLKIGEDQEEESSSPDEEEGSPVSPRYLLLGQASLSMPLFSGFRFTHAVRSAEYLEKAASLDAEADKAEIVLNIVDAWCGLFKARAAVGLVEENLKQAQQRVKDFTNLEANGLLARNDLLKARLQQADVELALLDARNNLETSNYQMNLLLGLPDSTVLLVDSTQLPDLPEAVSLGQLEEGAIDSRKDLAALHWKEQAASEKIRVTAGERWPSLGLSAGYIAADLDNVLTLTNAVNVGLGLKFNLSSLYKTGSKMKQAREQELQLRLAGEQLSDAVKTQVYKAFGNYEVSLKKIEVYGQAVEQAAENYRITKNKHTNNLATTTDLLDADVALLKTRLDAVYARADALLAWCRLLQTAGRLEPGSLNNL